MIIASFDEQTAREWAKKLHHSTTHRVGDKGDSIQGHGDEGSNLWGDPLQSSCTDIGSAGMNVMGGIICTDHIY